MVLLIMLFYFYFSINLICFEGMIICNMFVMLFFGIVSLFCMVVLVGVEGLILIVIFIMLLIILMFYSKKVGLDKYFEIYL